MMARKTERKEHDNDAHEACRTTGLAWVAGVLAVLFVAAIILIGYNAAKLRTLESGAPAAGTGGAGLVAMEGSANAPVTIIEYSDFQCPYCGRFETDAYPQIKAQYIDTGKAKLIYKEFPLSIHPNAEKAAEAAECALAQGQAQFWKLHDQMFANQNSLTVDNLKAWAAQLGLNAAQFNTCLDSGQMAAVVQQEEQEGQQAGVQGTPSFLINGKLVVGAQPFSAFQQAIDAALAAR